MKFIEKYIKALPTAEWIQQKSGLPWLKLDIQVPYKDILKEWELVKDFSVNHRENDSFYNLQNKGWKSLTIYGASAITTTTTKENYKWTEIADLCPLTTDWIKNTFEINENTGRIRFMFLEPSGYILPHKDRENQELREINVAISQPDKCYFKFANYGIIPFKNGDAFMIDTSKEHAVYNQDNFPRLHIILHTRIDNNIVERSYGNLYHNS